MPEGLLLFVRGMVIALGIGVVGYFVALAVGRLVRSLSTRWLGGAWAGYLTNLMRFGIMLGTVGLMLEQAGAAALFVIVATALTGAAAIGSEQLAADLIAGIKLLVFRHYQIGDFVTIAGHDGEVIQVTLTYTVLQSEDQQKIIIPNAMAIDDIIINHTALNLDKLSLPFPIAAEQDLAAIMALITTTAQGFTPRATDGTHEPRVLLTEIQAASATLVLEIYVFDKDDPDQLASNLRLRIFQALKTHAIVLG